MRETVIENITDIIEQCKKREISCSEIATVFDLLGLERPKRWNSIQKILQQTDEKKLNKLVHKMGSFLENHQYFNNKQICIFKLNDTDRDRLLSKIRPENINVIQDEMSDTLDEMKFQLNEIKEIEDCIIIKFSKTRKVKLKEAINLSIFNEDVQQNFDQYNELIGVKHETITCHDSIILNNNLLILQLDLANLFSIKELELYQNELLEVFRNSLNYIGIQNKPTPINFFNCINNFYNKENGYVVELSFITTKGVHHEKLKANARDIRKANYHIGGKKEEGIISPYRNTKRFDINSKFNGAYQIEIFVGVSHHYFNQAGSHTLKYANIYGIKDIQGYQKTIEIIMSNI